MIICTIARCCTRAERMTPVNCGRKTKLKKNLPWHKLQKVNKKKKKKFNLTEKVQKGESQESESVLDTKNQLFLRVNLTFLFLFCAS